MKFHTFQLLQLVLVFHTLIIIAPTYSQVPDAFKYQAIARDSEGNPIADQSVGFLIRVLLGSASGTEVYAETHSTTTNGYGLANLELGRGDRLGDASFDGISWESGPFFIEISLDGQRRYLLPAPWQQPVACCASFAMYAQQADSTVFADSAMYAQEADSAVFADSTMYAQEADSAVFADSTIHAQRAAIADSVAGLPLVYQVGDTVLGGVVFYVDGTGRHGLVAALSEQSQGIKWGDAGSGILGIKGVFGGSLVMGAGHMNTAVIVAAHPNTTTAAHLCAQYTGGGYGDWYLPSTTEGKLLGYFPQRQ